MGRREKRRKGACVDGIWDIRSAKASRTDFLDSFLSVR